MTNQEIIRRTCNHINPYVQNIIVNADKGIQKGIVDKMGDKFAIPDSNQNGEWHVLHFDGIELLKSFQPMITAINEWCMKNNHIYGDIENEYRELQKTNINELSKKELEEFIKKIWAIERKREKEAYNRKLIHQLFSCYFIGEIYMKIMLAYPPIRNLKSLYLLDGKEEEQLNKLQIAIKNGDIEYYINSDNYLYMDNLFKLCRNQQNENHHSFFTLIKNEEGIVDNDLHKVINCFIAQRASSLSMNLMTRVGYMYSDSLPYTVVNRNYIEETHDFSMINVQYIKKRL